MRLRAAAFGLGCCLILSCGARSADDASDPGTVSKPTTDDAEGTDPPATSESDVPPVQAAPEKHRAQAEACDDTRPPGMFNGAGSGDGVQCTSDADCTEGSNGRCVDRRGPSCTYDECFADSECSTGGPCGCEEGFWSDYNACLGGNCQVDADCGEEGYCSPSFGSCGAYSGVIAYYCRTKEDTCVEDADCANAELGTGYCALFPEVGHWACQYGQCVG